MRQLSEVVDFEALLARDRRQAARDGTMALAVRDRALAEKLPAEPPRARLTAWVEARRDLEESLPGLRAQGLVTLLGWALLGLGLAAGVGTATALLAYDGRSPINVLAWLFYLAFVPLALGVILLLGLLVPNRWMPRAGAAQALLGALVEPLLRRLPEGPDWVGRLLGRATGGAALQRWLLVGLTQVLTLGFLLAALATLLVKVTLTDLTFSWSTTLDVKEAQVTQLVEVVAAPWAAMLPSAVPNEADVAATNYQRFVERFRDTPERRAVDPSVGAKWWKLCAAAVLVYGVFPRILFLILSWWQWRKAVRGWPRLDRPGVRGLLERFEDSGGSFVVRSRGSSDRDEEPDFEPEANVPTDLPSITPGLVIAWGAAAGAEPEALEEVVPMPAGTEKLGVGLDLDLDAEQAALTRAAALAAPALVLMPLDEPPVEDVLAFLRELRSVTPVVQVLGVESSPGGWTGAPLDPGWRKALARLEGVEARSFEAVGARS